MEFFSTGIDRILRRHEKKGDEVMQKYKHKSLTVWAARWIGTSESEQEIRSIGAIVELSPRGGSLMVSTPAGVELCRMGDWVVSGQDVSVWAHADFVLEFEHG